MAELKILGLKVTFKTFSDIKIKYQGYRKQKAKEIQGGKKNKPENDLISINKTH